MSAELAALHLEVSIRHMVLSVPSKHLSPEKDTLHLSFPLDTELKGYVHKAHSTHIPEM